MSMFQTDRLRRVTLLPAVMTAVLFMAGVLPGPGLTVPDAIAADASSDIPGVALPGPIATGRLGGSIYDVVYSFSVAPGYVIVASLIGTAGTDFDIYLFDSTATSVGSTVGLLTKSIGPTSVESISWPSRFGGTYYIDLNGATDVQGDFRLTVQAAPDATPPVVSVVLADGRGSTNQLTVPVALTASDDLSGVTEMALSGDGVTFTAWQPFQHSTSWTFVAGDGLRTLWAKVKNGVGLESGAATDTVTIDTTPPVAIAVQPAPGSSPVGLLPRFSVTFNEQIDAITWNDDGLIVQAATGALVPGAYAFDAPARTGSFVPSSALQPGTSYIVTVGDVTDLAGNRAASSGSWSITPVAATSLDVRIDPKVLVYGGSARLDAALIGAPLPADIAIDAASNASGFTPLATLPIQDGRATLVVTPGVNTTYRFRYAGAFGVAPAQIDVPFLVRRAISLAAGTSGVVSTARVGGSVVLTAAVRPADAGVSVSFRLYRYDAARRIWVYAGSKGRSTDSAGRASYTWSPTSTGSYYWRVYVASTAANANNVSPVYRWSVSR